MFFFFLVHVGENILNDIMERGVDLSALVEYSPRAHCAARLGPQGTTIGKK